MLAYKKEFKVFKMSPPLLPTEIEFTKDPCTNQVHGNEIPTLVSSSVFNGVPVAEISINPLAGQAEFQSKNCP